MDTEILDAIKRRAAEEQYPRKLGIVLQKAEPGYALVEMPVSDDMGNIFHMAHGGAIFSLIDEAFEISCNTYGTVAVALNMNVTYHRSPSKGAVLRAESREIYRSAKTASYDIKVTDDNDRLIASCRALAYRKKEKLPFL
ncbi:MAG: PaaI family thioesterase [Thermodesulfobacteriota bacterium]